ncbi:transcriptional regulator [Mesorhizobium sp. NBSH29]|uniref:winged helix-turn-helix transcriptional regulator n=1 Tax=Mesorhizobium sp. NBSH29 TaxID=2654249 RepID=UPI0018964A08|nr:helix-turn-helix domain-containing protein [Mesorhizobium sp. NBSH29]QPC88394.1 transcriptional regulator [Mesorhizobium sp. NBSH29]
MKPALRYESEDCRAISDILGRVGDKWTVLVVGYLTNGPMRFTELRRQVGGISQKMLTTTLRGLERDGFVTRTVLASIPPRVDYELTDLGRELQVPVNALGEWARINMDRVKSARKRFDENYAAPVPVRSTPLEPGTLRKVSA